MEIKIGTNIAALRRERGMTQEQLAKALGVSSPAVSKWETGTSCPDISLLCPLARALGTNVDTLLEFEEKPSEEYLINCLNAVIETARTKGAEEGEKMMQELLHRYPSSTSLKYQAYIAFLTMEMMDFGSRRREEKKEEWKKQRQELLEAVYEDRTCPYWQEAVAQLVSLALSEGNLERAEQLLNEIPKHRFDPTMFWAQLYTKQGEQEKALETVQKQLFYTVHQLLNCLGLMLNEKIQPDMEKELEICEIYRKCSELFGLNTGMEEGLLAEVYLRAGDTNKGLESMGRFVDAAVGPAQLGNPTLFSPGLNMENKENIMASTPEMRQMLLHGMETDEACAGLREKQEFQRFIRKLRKSLSD